MMRRSKQAYLEMGRIKVDGGLQIIEALQLPPNVPIPMDGLTYARWLGGTIRWPIDYQEAVALVGAKA